MMRRPQPAVVVLGIEASVHPGLVVIRGDEACEHIAGLRFEIGGEGVAAPRIADRTLCLGEGRARAMANGPLVVCGGSVSKKASTIDGWSHTCHSTASARRRNV